VAVLDDVAEALERGGRDIGVPRHNVEADVQGLHGAHEIAPRVLEHVAVAGAANFLVRNEVLVRENLRQYLGRFCPQRRRFFQGHVVDLLELCAHAFRAQAHNHLRVRPRLHCRAGTFRSCPCAHALALRNSAQHLRVQSTERVAQGLQFVLQPLHTVHAVRVQQLLFARTQAVDVGSVCVVAPNFLKHGGQAMHHDLHLGVVDQP